MQTAIAATEEEGPHYNITVMRIDNHRQYATQGCIPFAELIDSLID